MKKFLIILSLIFISISPAFSLDDNTLSGKDLITFSQDERWGLKDKNGNVIIEPD